MENIKQLSFKQYLESKEKLREAIKNTPQRTAHYIVRKYCNLTVGETKEEKTQIKLRPKHKIIVDWLYEDIDNPTPVNIRFEGPPNNEQDYSTFWSGSKLLKWLVRNAREEDSFL